MRGEPTFIERPSLEDYAAATQDALRRRDFALALEMVSAALTFDPTAPDLLELLDAVLAGAPASLLEAPLDDSAFFGTVAVRARIAVDAGRLGRGIETLLAVAAFRPMIPYLRWLPAWVERSPALRGVSAEGVAAGVARLLRTSDVSDEDPTRSEAPALRGLRENLACAGLLCRKLGDARAQHRAKLAVLESMILRRLGRPRDARARLEAVGAGSIDSGLFVELGTVLRDLGDVEAASATLRRAIEAGAAAPETWLDFAATLLDAADFDGARDAAERARALTGDEALRAEAEAVAAHADVLRAPDDAEARARLRDLAATFSAAAPRWRDISLHRTELEPPSDALAEVVRHAVQRAARDRPPQPLRVRLRTAAVIPTSARVAFAAALRDEGLEGDLMSADDAELEPIAALREVAEVDLAADAAITELAVGEIDVDAWCVGAAQLDVARAASLACALSSGRQTPSDPIEAFHRRAVAALCLAVRTAAAEPRVVTELAVLARGSDPWLGSAAIIALGGLGRTNVTHASEVCALLEDLCAADLDDDPRVISALRVLCTIPGTPLESRRVWHARRVALERVQGGHDT